MYIEERQRQKKKQWSSLLFGGKNSFNYSTCRASYFACLWWFLRIGLIHTFLSHHPGVHLIIQLILRKTASAGTNLIKPPPPPQTEATTFAFSSLFIIQLCPIIKLLHTWWPKSKNEKLDVTDGRRKPRLPSSWLQLGGEEGGEPLSQVTAHHVPEVNTDKGRH